MVVEVHLVGGGIYPQRDLTIGGLEVLRGARLVVYTNFPDAQGWLSGLGVRESRDLSSLYRSTGVDRDNYGAMLSAILSESDKGGYVAYLVAGHPWLGVSTTQELAKLAKGPAAQIRVISTPGISSMDTLMVDLQLDMLERGCLVVDSNRLLLFRFNIDPRLGLMVYHASAVGTSITNYERPWEDNQLQLLQSFLMDHLQPSSPFYAVRSQSSDQHQTTMFSGTLIKLTEESYRLDYGTTLYFPPSPPSGIDLNYLKLLMPQDGA